MLLAELNRIPRVNNKVIMVPLKTELRGKQLRTGFETEELQRSRSKQKQAR